MVALKPHASRSSDRDPQKAGQDWLDIRKLIDLPVFDRPMEDPPSRVPYDVAVRAFEELIVTVKLREKTPRVAEDIPEFKM